MKTILKNLPTGITASEVHETVYKNFKIDEVNNKFKVDENNNLIVESTYTVKSVYLFSNETGFDGIKKDTIVASINLTEGFLSPSHGYFAPHKTGVKVNNWFKKHYIQK